VLRLRMRPGHAPARMIRIFLLGFLPTGAMEVARASREAPNWRDSMPQPRAEPLRLTKAVPKPAVAVPGRWVAG